MGQTSVSMVHENSIFSDNNRHIFFSLWWRGKKPGRVSCCFQQAAWPNKLPTSDSHGGLRRGFCDSFARGFRGLARIGLLVSRWSCLVSSLTFPFIRNRFRNRFRKTVSVLSFRNAVAVNAVAVPAPYRQMGVSNCH